VEPIAYLGAPIRRWPVIIPVVLVAVLVALLIPVHSASSYPGDTWQAPAQVGLNPSYPDNKLGAKLGLKQLAFYAHAPAVVATAAKAAGVPITNHLTSDVVVTKTKTPGKPGTLTLAVRQPTKSRAVSLTNALVAALASYTHVQLVNHYKNSVYIQQAYITNLQNAINNLPKHTTTTTPTTPTTIPKVKVKKVVVNPTTTTAAPTTTTTHATTTTSTTTTTPHALGKPTSNASLTSFTGANGKVAHTRSNGSDQKIVLVDTTATTATTVATTPTTLPAGAPGAPTTPATQSLPNRALVVEQKVLASELGTAQAYLERLKAQGVVASGYKVVAPATPSSAFRLNPSPSLLSNSWIRLLLGLLIGLIVGILLTWLIDAFDRTIRTTKRAEEVFGLPVVVEVPAVQSASLSVIPIVDIVVDPYSATSEAYRQLHVAIMTAPTVNWVRRAGIPGDPWELPALPPRSLVGAPGPAEAADDPVVVGTTADPGAGRVAGDHPTAETRIPATVKTAQLVVPRRSRFSILVTSPTDEPSRSLVVVNLAAVFAEAGDRVLVATTGGMRTEFEANGRGTQMWEPDRQATDAAELVANARPSQIPGVSSLALGQIFSNPSRLAGNATDLIEAARDVVDVLLLEATLLTTQDGAALLPVVDLVVVVCEAWYTKVADGARSRRLLAQRRPPVLGLAMTNIPADHAKILNG
jgi:Mrp family chromosome partitioning ATPase